MPGDQFATADRINRVNSPVLVIHGRRDDIVPFDHGETCHKLAKHKVMLGVKEKRERIVGCLEKRN